jgi:amino acid adenylation domain-containing protein
MTDVSDRIAVLSPERQELLARLRKADRDAQVSSAERPGPRPGAAALAIAGGTAPLSYAQRRLWFVDQLGGSVAYSAPVVHRIRGPLNVALFATSLRTVISRHESLRTIFPERDGEPVQLVTDVAESVMDVRSVEHLPVGEREPAAVELLRAEVANPFDLSAGPVMRVLVIRLEADNHIVVLNIHHITSDQWSMGILVREAAECYAAGQQGRDPELPELPVSYADYAVWQREYLSRVVLTDGLRFWEEQLAGMQTLDLPTDRPRLPRPGHCGAELSRWLLPQTVAGIREVGASAGTSPFMTLLAGFVGLLSRYTGEYDIAVGTTAAGREHDDVAGLIGFFVNTLILRTDLSGDPTLIELLTRIRRSVLDAHQHAEVPFDLLVERLQPVRDPGRSPLVPVMFQQDNTPDYALSLPGLDVELIDDFDPGTAKYDLLVSVRVWENALRVHVQYDTELFDGTTVERLLQGYEVLLQAAVTDPNAPVSSLPLLTDADVELLGRRWNDTSTETAGHECLHTTFERQSATRPAATAVIAGGARHSFADIDSRANRLAHHVVTRGVGPGTPVAVYLPMGVDYVVSVLAVLKAGGAFVPVDPQYPPSRVAFILDDVAAPVVITTTALAAGLAPARATVVELDGADRQAVARCPASSPHTAVGPVDLCYIIYTSGSTGSPKGVVLRHAGVANNLDDLRTRFAVGPGDAVLALSSPSFDMSVYEILGVPGSGGAVVLPEPELARDPAHWVELVKDHAVTVWNSAPALLDLFLTEVEQSADPPPKTLRLALLGGDWVPVSMPDRLRALVPELEFVSLGGATEASIHSIVYPVGEVDPEWTSIPYGRPMANQEAYILDDRLELLPIGVPGELHLGGVGLAVGYLNRPELTAEKFVEWRGRRLYRTGDLARWRQDGVLQLLGRRDLMFKVNGLRVEPGEIEWVLRGHPAITDAVVAARTDSVGDRGLVGYVLSSSAVPIPELRSLVSAVLPSYMVPSTFVVLDRFPLSPNGKVDRKALAQFDGRSDAGLHEPPSGPVEEQIAQVWRTVLDVAELNRTDDFFTLGGDSFKAVRVARTVGGGVPVIAVFRHPTIAALAAYLETDVTATAPHRLLHRLTPEREQASVSLVCVPYGGGNVVAYQPLADALDERFALWSVDLPGHDLADTTPLAAIEDVAVRCAEEIRDRIDGPIALYGQCAGTAATLALSRRLEAIGVPVLATFMGAALPDNDLEWSWRMVQQGSDEQLFGHMRRLGGFDGVLDDHDIAGILAVVRHDLAEMVQLYLREADGSIPTLTGPVHCVVGDTDPATEGYETRYRDWDRYGTGVTLSVVAGGGHYFCKYQPGEVAAIVARRLAD